MDYGVEQSPDKRFRTSFIELQEKEIYSCMVEDIEQQAWIRGLRVVLKLEVTRLSDENDVGVIKPYINFIEESGSAWHKFCKMLFGEERLTKSPVESQEFLGQVFSCQFKKVMGGKNKDKERWPIYKVRSGESGNWISLSGS